MDTDKNRMKMIISVAKVVFSFHVSISFLHANKACDVQL